MPTGIKLGIPYDSTTYINDAINEVVKTLGETLIIVMLVIFLFMGSLRAVLVPITAIPISLIGAVLLMLVLGFTINLLTLLAIVLSVGLVVDDAIVVVENVERHMQEGKNALQAALIGARELVGPIVAMTITLAAVYTPIGIQGGLTGALFREFAFTLAGAVVVSGVVALTLSPMMSSKLLRAQDSHTGFGGWVNQRFDALRQWYKRRLIETLRWRPVTLTLAGLVILLILYAANLYAAYEISIFRARPTLQVIGSAAVLPVIGPIIFLAMPTKMEAAETGDESEAAGADQAVAPVEDIQIVDASWNQAEKPPEAQIFPRGRFTFNKRFVETKFAGFIGTPMGDALKFDMTVKTAQADFMVERIAQVNQNEAIFETDNGQVSVALADIQEIQLNPKTA
jgi:hypothetical protein